MGRLGHVNDSRPLKRELFPAGFAGEVMNIVISTWQTFVLGGSVRLEIPITALFRRALIAAYEAADRNWFITLEDPIVDQAFGTEEGRNDLNFYPPRHHRQTVFFTVECKRLHVTTQSGFATQVDAYVTHGVKRFVEGTYSSGLPCGGMLGYVMDNNVSGAFASVGDAIKSRRKELKVRGRIGIPSKAASFWVNSADTVHRRSDGDFVLHHAFLGVIRP